MGIDTRYELDEHIVQMSDLEIETRHRSCRNCERQRHYTMTRNARKELLAREEGESAMSTRRIGFSRALEEGT